MAALVLVAAFPAAASARVSTITAVCRTGPVPNPPPPTTGDFHVTLNVPRRVHQGATFTAHLTVDFAVAPSSQVGAAFLSGGPGASPLPGILAVAGGSPTISGDITFSAIGTRGTLIEWRLLNFGQGIQFGGVAIAETCTPTTDVVLARTRIVRAARHT